jgi:hypothetical protein
MKITILNGNPAPENQAFDGYLERLSEAWQSAGHAVNNLELRSMTIAYCTGCFGCWVKTPGECIARDEAREVWRAAINSDFVLFASPLLMGFPSALLKKVNDKLLPTLHPYFVIDHGEVHHRGRYDRYPELGLLLEKSQDTDDEDLAIVSEIYSRIAINWKSRLGFTHLTTDPVEEVAHEIDRL